MSTTTTLDEFVEREMTLEEWGAMDEDAEGELVDGHLVAEEEVGTVHDILLAWLSTQLFNWLGPRGGLVGACDTTRFAVSKRRGRKPDAFVYLPGRKAPAANLVRAPPDIMIEVVAPTPRDQRRDRLDKYSEYAAFGVRWYWIVDPTLRALEIFELTDAGRYSRVVGVSEGLLTDVPGMPGLELDVDAIWATGDTLVPEE